MSLEESGVMVFDCEHRTPSPAPHGYPYIGIPQMKGGRLDTSDARLVSDDDWPIWTRRIEPRGGDIVLSRRTNPGETAVVPDGLRCVLGQNLVLLRSSGGQVAQDYLRWAVRSPEWWDQIRSHINVGAVFDSLTVREIPKFVLSWPPREEQRAIADVLGALDDKIGVSRRMSETLDAMAGDLFRSWFVDFDFVRDTAERVDDRLDDHVIRSFPESPVDSETGELPGGWAIQPVGALALVVGGTTPKTDQPEYWMNGTYHWATPKDLANLRTPVLLDTARRITDAGLARIGSGLLPRGTALLSSRAPIGYLAVTEIPVAINQGFIAMIPKPGISNLFLLHWARHSLDVIVSHANGSTFLEISKANFRPLPVVTPPPPVLRAFDDLAQPLHARMVACERESLTLAALCDTLLPMLISGELRVPDAERIAVEAGA